MTSGLATPYKLPADAGHAVSDRRASDDRIATKAGHFLTIGGDTGLLSGDADIGHADRAAFLGGHAAGGASGQSCDQDQFLHDEFLLRDGSTAARAGQERGGYPGAQP